MLKENTYTIDNEKLLISVVNYRSNGAGTPENLIKVFYFCKCDDVKL